MKKKNCLHLLPKSEGGIRQHFLAILNSLIELPLNHLVTGPRDNDMIKELNKLSVEYIPLDWDGNPGITSMFHAFQQLKSIFLKKNIQIMHSHGHKISCIGRLASLATGKKINNIVTIHNFSPPSKLGRLMKICNQALDSYSTKIITVSHALLSEEVLFKNHHKTVVIYNGVDLNKFKPLEQEKEKAEVIGTVARLAPQKGINVLIKALKEITSDFPQVKLHLIGEGTERKALQDLAVKFGVANRVEFLGNIKDVISALNNIDIFVMPSLSEGLSIATLEAMSLKKPVIASGTGGLVEVVEADITGLIVKPGCHSELAVALRKFILSAELRKKMGENGRKRVVDIFDFNVMLKKTNEVYLKILDS